MTSQSGRTIDSSMHRDLEVVAQDTTVVDSAIRMRERSIGSVLVESGEPGGGRHRIVGIVTETDLVHKVIAQELNASLTWVAQIMAKPLLTITPDQSWLDASHLMEINHVRHLCVSEGGSIVGIISVRDLVRYFVDAEAGPVRELGDVYRPLSVLMRTSIETIDIGETLRAAARRMVEKHVGSLLVSQTEKLVGIVTESDMVRKALAYNLDPDHIRVGSLMNHPVIGIDINRTIHNASELMAEKGVRHLAVTEIDKIVGILSVRDLVRMISVRDRPRFLREKGK